MTSSLSRLCEVFKGAIGQDFQPWTLEVVSVLLTAIPQTVTCGTTCVVACISRFRPHIVEEGESDAISPVGAAGEFVVEARLSGDAPPPIH
jgi:hypothetical protein